MGLRMGGATFLPQVCRASAFMIVKRAAWVSLKHVQGYAERGRIRVPRDDAVDLLDAPLAERRRLRVVAQRTLTGL